MSAWTAPDEDVQALLAALDVVDTGPRETPPEFQYTNPVLVCVDAVLSIRRRYDDFVRPRIVRIESEWPEVASLADLLGLIESLGVDGFEKFWDYRHAERVHILKNLAGFFVRYRQDGGYADDMTAMRTWATQSTFSDHARFPVRGIGPATFQYLRMLLGVSTVKPDVHILGFVNTTLGRTVTNVQAINLLETVAERLGLTAQELDYSIWESRARPQVLTPSSSRTDLSEYNVQGLLALSRAILRELRERGVVRTGNAPAGDYAELLVQQATDGELAPLSRRSWDVLTPQGERLQVKARILTGSSRGERQLSPFRTWDFDAAVIVLFADDFSVHRAVCASVDALKAKGRFAEHVNGHIVFATDELLDEAEDWTARLREVQ